MQIKIIDQKKKKDYILKYNEKKGYSSINTNILDKGIKFYSMNILLIFIIINYFPTIISQNIKTLSTVYEVTIKVMENIEQPEQQKILGNLELLPNKITLNRVVKNTNISYSDLKPGENTIELFWDELPNCKALFSGIIGLKSVDLTSFDSSGCTDMTGMFSNCEHLESVNFGNFEISSVTLMDKMFYNCKHLKSLDLSKFKTDSLVSMESMFYNARELISLDLTSFRTSSVTNMNNMFNGCDQLIFLNLNSFVENNDLTIENIFSANINKLIYCINTEKSPKIYRFLKEEKNLENDCDNNCFNRETKIMKQEKKCVDSCDEQIYRIENNICEKKPEPLNKDTTKVSSKIIVVKESNKNDENTQFNSENFFKESQQTKNEELSNKDEVINSLKDDIINN